jgi:putative MATE family efflux protein
MLGSAAQNIIVLSDNVFLYHYNSSDFGAIGLVGAFYLIIASIGFGFSRGGQILIARKYGENLKSGIGSYFQSLIFFEFLMALAIMVSIFFYAEPFFSYFIESKEILARTLDYIYPRSIGIPFSFIGVCLIGLYTGVARPKFILIDTVILAVSNIILNYILIFGHLGFEPMGIKGAGIASTLAEIIAFIAFLIYMVFDKENRIYHLLKLERFSVNNVKQTISISSPIVAQSILGLGAYFIFFTLIENNSSKDLEISNLIRNVYLILSIPTWGYSTGINNIVSSFIGNRKRIAVLPMTWKTTKINVITTLIITIPICLFPMFFLYPLYGGGESNLLAISTDVLLLLIPIMALFSIGSIYLNGLIGTGHTNTAFWIQSFATFLYIVYIYIVVKIYKLNLIWAWSSEFVYWLAILLLSFLYLRTKKWHQKLF